MAGDVAFGSGKGRAGGSLLELVRSGVPNSIDILGKAAFGTPV